MNVANIARRLAAWDLHCALGRFEAIRRSYGVLKRLSPAPRNGIWPPPPYMVLPATHFPKVRAISTTAALKRDSIAFGFNLPADLVEEMAAFAGTAPLRNGGGHGTFRKEDVRGGRLPDGSPAVLGHALDPSECPAVRRVCRDPALLEAVTEFLGFPPSKAIPHLFWSFATDATDAERRRAGQPVDWHFDVRGFHFCSASFYLTDVDTGSGAHALVRGSHQGKTLKMLLRSARAAEADLLARFGADRLLVVEGPAGTGFLEDPNCYHKALAPVTRDRLLFQIRFG